jgi:hypothetical protein
VLLVPQPINVPCDVNTGLAGDNPAGHLDNPRLSWAAGIDAPGGGGGGCGGGGGGRGTGMFGRGIHGLGPKNASENPPKAATTSSKRPVRCIAFSCITLY